jgi:hypothetical protein
MDHIGADGTFTEDFSAAMISELGDGYVESEQQSRCKVLDDIHDIKSLAKSAIDSRRANTQLTEAAKRSIQRPADDASDADRAEFRKSLLVEAGATGNIADYKVLKPTDLPEGMAFNAEGADAMAELCCAQNIPLDIYKIMVETGRQNAVAAFKQGEVGRQEKFDAAVKAVTDAYQPDTLIERGRLAYKYVEEFGLPSGSEKGKAAILGGPTGETDDTGAIALDMNGQPKRHKPMYDMADDFGEWQRKGVSPAMLIHMASVAEQMQSGDNKRGDVRVGSETTEERQHREYLASINANSPDLQPAKS